MSGTLVNLLLYLEVTKPFQLREPQLSSTLVFVGDNLSLEYLASGNQCTVTHPESKAALWLFKIAF